MLVGSGVQLIIESGAGSAAGFLDSEYVNRGARVTLERNHVFESSNVIVQIRTFAANPDAGQKDLPFLNPGQTVMGLGEPLAPRNHYSDLASRGVTSFAMELMPRTTRAQSMDILSSMATISGYKAVLLAAGALPRLFPMLMTAEGTIVPARVLILGAGVAGLQAIATERSLCAVVSAYDVRPAVKEQVESLGAKFVSLGLDTSTAETSAGYATALGEEFYNRQRDLLAEAVREQDVIITTAAVPGQRAPLLLTREMISGMSPGSVVLDMAAEQGGNCAITQPGRNIVESGVTIMGPVNLPATVPNHASQMYARNIGAFLKHLIHNGDLTINLDDEITRETLVTYEGQIVHPRVRQIAQKEQSQNDAIR
jgi:NAD(P) transhydrogenase subunit alpha